MIFKQLYIFTDGGLRKKQYLAGFSKAFLPGNFKKNKMFG
jgi:hypothetical protein